jgi:hypothetical protein
LTTYTLDALKSDINSTRAVEFLKPLQSPIDFLNSLQNPAMANLSVQTVESTKTHQPTSSLNFFYKKQMAEKIDRENQLIMKRIVNTSPERDITMAQLRKRNKQNDYYMQII